MSASDWISLSGLIVASIGGVVGWLLRQLFGAIKELAKDLAALQKSLPETYVRKDDMGKMEDKILSEIRDLAFRIDRHVEESVARWVNSERNPLPPGTPHGG